MDHLAARRTGRTLRDWCADLALFVAAVLYATGWYVALIDDPSKDAERMTALFVVALLGCCLLWLRRRWPVVVACCLIPLSVIDDLTSGAMLAALLTVAIHRPVKTTAVLCSARILAVAVYLPLRAGTDQEIWWVVAYSIASSLGVVGWGLFLRHRRQLILSLRDRAERAETEARLRAEHSQHLAREEIAREMHDVLGHRLSMLSVHAGALEYRPDAPSEDVARAAGVIRTSAHEALQELRAVIGVLRAPVDELPQPTYADLADLIAESDGAGMRVTVRDEVVGEVPERVGRTAYRIVQEALTNVRKHAPGARVEVCLVGTPEDGLNVQIRNTVAGDLVKHQPRGACAGPAAERTAGAEQAEAEDTVVRSGGAGYGLSGLAERVALSGGRLEYAPTGDGGFRVAGWIPWGHDRTAQ